MNWCSRRGRGVSRRPHGVLFCLTTFHWPDIQTPTKLGSSVNSCLVIGASGASSSTHTPPFETHGGLASPYNATEERDRAQNEGYPLSNSELLPATSRPQVLPGPRQLLNQASSDSDSPLARLPESVATTTDSASTSSSTSAAAETPQ